MGMRVKICLGLTLFSIAAVGYAVDRYTLQEVDRIPHQGAYRFTEGLEFYKGYLYEGTGRSFSTALKKIDPDSGEVLMERKVSYLPFHLYFGEGITIYNDQLLQISYKSGKAYFYGLEHFGKVRVRHEGDLFWHNKEFRYSGDGWGLTKNSQHFINSNGSSTLYFRNFKTFEIERTVTVTLDGKEVPGENELEYVDGIIYANLFPKSPLILMIDEKDGKVIGVIDASNLECSQMSGINDVLNGIAYNPAESLFYLTGKNCPYIYKVRFIKQL
ncbi:MAG: glutaminyl-peptide cyclotransferase [Oligoflexia bacterium]|nr:glutaminyl-peptide cyclotransferase [Oligoflexia bacterium]MBF0366589.1 glutaminyl-peptide cyclotransferase [Oligoflexia bacterium]